MKRRRTYQPAGQPWAETRERGLGHGPVVVTGLHQHIEALERFDLVQLDRPTWYRPWVDVTLRSDWTLITDSGLDDRTWVIDWMTLSLRVPPGGLTGRPPTWEAATMAIADPRGRHAVHALALRAARDLGLERERFMQPA